MTKTELPPAALTSPALLDKGLLKHLRSGAVRMIPSQLLWLCGPLEGLFGVCDDLATGYVAHKGVLLTLPNQPAADAAAAELARSTGRKFKVVEF